MKISIIGANGKQGSLLTDEAVRRGYDVTAIIRHDKPKNPNAKLLQKDLFDLTAEDLKGFDAVIDAFGAWTPETIPQHITSLRHLCSCVENTKIRLIIVGGAACLYVNKEHTLMLLDTPDFPEMFKPLANAETEAFLELKKRTNVLWTYISPPFDFKPEGERTGKYKIGGIELPYNAKGESTISYADYAIAVIDELQNAQFIQQNFSVVSL